jgi:retron-type reverse transcriptase
MAIIKLIDQISEEIDNKNYTIGIFIDLSKAFDTINHTILLDKLNLYGVRGIAHDWFNSYLKHRQQFVQIGDSKSELLTITCGVPQGSILGPLLLLLYINDFVNVSKLGNTIMSADDTNLFFKDKSLSNLVKIIN